MTTISYPSVGKGGFPETKWDAIFGADDGIVADYSPGGAFSLSRLNGTNMARIGLVGSIGRKAGYNLELTAEQDLSCPAVSVTTDYLIAIEYDPTLNVAQQPSGNADPAGPCRLIVATDALPTSGGKQHLLLYKITRSPSQDLTAAVVTDYRCWTGPTIVMPKDLRGTPSFGPYPRGTHLFITTGGRCRHLVRDSDGTALVWRGVNLEDPIGFPLASGIGGQAGEPPQYYRFAGSMVKCRGRVTKAFAAGAAVNLGVLPVGFRPAYFERMPVRCSAGLVFGGVGPDGTVSITGPTAAATWVDLSPITFRAEQ